MVSFDVVTAAASILLTSFIFAINEQKNNQLTLTFFFCCYNYCSFRQLTKRAHLDNNCLFFCPLCPCNILMKGASLVAPTVKCLPTMRETQVQSLGQEDPLEKEMQPTPVFLPGKSHGLRNLLGYSPWGRKESDTTEWLHFLTS